MRASWSLDRLETNLELPLISASTRIWSRSSVSYIDVACDGGLAVDVRAGMNDCVLVRWNISPPASRGVIGVAMAGIVVMCPMELGCILVNAGAIPL